MEEIRTQLQDLNPDENTYSSLIWETCSQRLWWINCDEVYEWNAGVHEEEFVVGLREDEGEVGVMHLSDVGFTEMIVDIGDVYVSNGEVHVGRTTFIPFSE